MAVSMGGSGAGMSEMNVTPMIDILLVLLIIFMVIVPVSQKGLQTLLPQPPRNDAAPAQAIVVQVLDRSGAAPAYKINDVDVAHDQLFSKLTEIFASRAERVVFVKGGGHVNFAAVADVIDIARAANVDHVALMTSKLEAGR
jgi:biopolymer transport protein TolR